MIIYYTLSITVPDEIDADTLAEIEQDAEPHDVTLEDKIRRWLGGTIEGAEEVENDLPDGWSVKIHD